MKRLASAVIATWLLPSVAHACASCGCGDPTLTTMGVEKPFKNRIRLSFEQRLGGQLERDLQTESIIARSTFTGSWSPTTWLTVGAALPVISGQLQVQHHPVRRLAGLGDLELYGRALVFRDRSFSPRHLGAVLVGIKLPTGPRVEDSSGYPAKEDFQPGSASVDGIFGASYSYFGDSVSVFASLSYRHTTTGWRGYRRGSKIGASAILQHPIHDRIALALGMDFGHARPDEVAPPESTDNLPLPNTGGTLLSVTPQVLFSLRTDWLLRVAVQAPVLQSWNADQSEYPTGVVSLTVDL